MAKILYVKDDLHRRLKLLATKMGVSMQEATESAVDQWLERAEEDQRMQEVLMDRIEKKLSQEEREVLATVLAKKGSDK